MSQKDLDIGSLYPPLEDIQHCSSVIAHRVVEYAYKHGRSRQEPRLWFATDSNYWVSRMMGWSHVIPKSKRGKTN